MPPRAPRATPALVAVILLAATLTALAGASAAAEPASIAGMTDVPHLQKGGTVRGDPGKHATRPEDIAELFHIAQPVLQGHNEAL